MPDIFGRALIIGAGMGGLAAAAALSKHFKQVVVLERDEVLSDGAPRPGTPQAAHAHAVLASGLNALERLLPGFEDDLVRAGAVPIAMSSQSREEVPGIGVFPRRDLGFTAYGMSRPLIETALRRRVEQLSSVVLQPHCRVMEILSSPAGDRVTGVRSEGEGGAETLTADLVIDASGRGTLTLAAALARTGAAGGNQDRHQHPLCHRFLYDPG
jgi:2-polyprenyl-6-methoxyphenol hydroxylase-like FAD-dependent oxidoreductase